MFGSTGNLLATSHPRMVLGFAIVAVFAMAVVATIVATVGEQMKPQDPALAPQPLMYEYPPPPPPPPPPINDPDPSRNWEPYGSPYDDEYADQSEEDFDIDPDGTVSTNYL